MWCPQNAEQKNSFSKQAWLKLAEQNKSSDTVTWAVSTVLYKLQEIGRAKIT